MRYNPCATGASLAAVPLADGDIAITAVTKRKSKSSATRVTVAVITLTVNPDRDLVELRFPGKPDDAVRAEMKAAKFRWYGPAGCWYHKHTPENLAWANEFLIRQGGSTGVSPVVSGVPPETPPIATVTPNVRIVPQIPAMPGFSPLGLSRGNIVAPPAMKHALALKHLDELKDFIGTAQRAVLLQNFKGEEKDWFFDKVWELADIVREMPKTHEGRGRDAIAHLRYFAGGQAAWFITEKDMGCETDEVSGQHQAYGLADLFGDGGEVGYISIAEILANGGELDFHFTPQTIAAIRSGEENIPGPASASQWGVEIAESPDLAISGHQGNCPKEQTEPKYLTAQVPAWRQRRRQ